MDGIQHNSLPPKPVAKVVKRHNLETVMKAIEDVTENGLSLRASSNKYGIPRETLSRQIWKHKNGIKLNFTPGPVPVLRDDEEAMLCRWIVDCGHRGFCLNRMEISKSVQLFLSANGRKTIFKDNLPQRRWYDQFQNRHTELKELPKMGKFEFKAWFEMINDQVFKDDHELRSIVQHSERIFLVEEIRFSLNPNGVNISAATAITNSIEVDYPQNKSISILLNFNAAGEAGPPQIVYPLEEIPSEISETIPSAWGVGKNRTGLVDADLFYNYIENVFVPYLAQYNIQLPVILLVNPELTPISYKLFKLCQKEKIVLLGLYQLATGILGRCRVTAFNILENWITYHPYEDFRLDQLTAIVNQFFEHTTTLSWSLVEEFRFCGLFPWGPNLVDERHLASSEQLNKSVSKVKPSHGHHPQNRLHVQQQSNSSINHHHQNHPHNNQPSGQIDLQFLYDQNVRQQTTAPVKAKSTTSIGVGTDDDDSSGPTINYAQFCEVIGQTLVDHCEKTSASKEFDLGRDNLIILRKLFNMLQPRKTLQQKQSSNTNTTTTNNNNHSSTLTNGVAIDDVSNELSFASFLLTKRKPSQRPSVPNSSSSSHSSAASAASVAALAASMSIPPSLIVTNHHHHRNSNSSSAAALANIAPTAHAPTPPVIKATPTTVPSNHNAHNPHHHQQQQHQPPPPHPHRIQLDPQLHYLHQQQQQQQQQQQNSNNNNNLIANQILANNLGEPPCNLELSFASFFQ